MNAFVRIVKRLLLVVCLTAVIACAVTVWEGYSMYRDALATHSIEQVVEDARNQPGYTPADELPQRYLDAVVAVEDHRFYSHGGIDLIAICRAATICLLRREPVMSSDFTPK